MKPKTLLGGVALIGFTLLLFANFGQQVGGYMDFEQAAATGSQAHVVGMWDDSQPVRYDRQRNVFSFYMADEAGHVREVRYPNPKPANFEDADQLVVEGRIQDDVFVASHILVKCPSKYNETQGFETNA